MREIGWIEHGSVQDWDDIGLKLTWSKKASPSRRPWRVELAARGRLRWRVVLGCGSRAAAGGESRKEYGRGGKSGTRSEIPDPTFLLGTLPGPVRYRDVGQKKKTNAAQDRFPGPNCTLQPTPPF